MVAGKDGRNGSDDRGGRSGSKDEGLGPASNENDSDDSSFSLGRLREFIASPGDLRAQDELVHEVLWQATRLSTSESMESTIQSHLDAASETLSEMYTKSTRDIEERNERLAIQTSLPNISKWNQQLIAGNKASKQHRQEISKELALVDALLKRTARKTRVSGRRRRRTIKNTQVQNATSGISQASSWDNPGPSGSTKISKSGGLLFTTVVCAVAFESFDRITSREGGAAHLANYAAFSSLLILSLAYLKALHRVAQNAHEELQQHTDPYRRRDP